MMPAHLCSENFLWSLWEQELELLGVVVVVGFGSFVVWCCAILSVFENKDIAI
jgi:hypothetical protein